MACMSFCLHFWQIYTFQVITMMLGSLFIVSSLVVITGTKGEWVNSKAIWQTIWDESCPCEYHLKTNWIQGATLDECKARCMEIERCNAIQFRSVSKIRQVQRYLFFEDNFADVTHLLGTKKNNQLLYFPFKHLLRKLLLLFFFIYLGDHCVNS